MSYLKYLLFFLLISNSLLAQSEGDFNCYSILAGKEATTDGSVFLAHNEDDWGDRVVNFFKVPARSHSATDSVTLHRGGKLEQPSHTHAYLWLEMPGLEFSDSYINEYGVSIVSDACSSKEDQPEITGGGIGYQLRRLMAERAKTAREAVQIGGALVDRFGYISSGRTYCIAGPNETWMLSVVKGKHWIARRIPDNQVAIIPNYYTIDQVHLKDTVNFLGSPDLISYAQKRGWYDPEKDGEFNFRKVYGSEKSLENIRNKARHWVILNQLSEKSYAVEDVFPFSFVPKKKVDLPTLFQLLRNHYEGTEFDITGGKTGNPHQQKTMSVCSMTNQYGVVAQLRNYMPATVGNVLWIAPRRPCTEAFVPLYPAMDQVPEKWHATDWQTALQKHFDKVKNYQKVYPNHPYWILNERIKKYDDDYYNLIGKRHKKTGSWERKLLRRQNRFEHGILTKFSKHPEKIPEILRKYSFKYLEKDF